MILKDSYLHGTDLEGLIRKIGYDSSNFKFTFTKAKVKDDGSYDTLVVTLPFSDYILKTNAVDLTTPLTIAANKTFNSSVSITDLTAGSLVVNGSTRLDNDLYTNIIKSGTWNGNPISLDYGGTFGTTTIGYILTANDPSGKGLWSNPANLTIGTASKLGSSTLGSTTKGIYLNAGTATEMTYSLSATVNSSTANYATYYSGTNTVSGTSILIYDTTNGKVTITGNGKGTPLTIKGGISGYRHNIQLIPSSDWSGILFGGNDKTAEGDGTTANSYWVGNNNGKFSISLNGSGNTAKSLYCDGTDWYANTNKIWHGGNLTTTAAANGGTTAALVTTGDKYNWNSVYNWYSAATDHNTDATISKWQEIVSFLSGITDTQTLNGILNGYVTLGTTLTITGAKSFSNPISGNLLGNAATADRLKNAVTVSLTGNVTGSATFDGSGNLSISTTVSGGSATDDTKVLKEGDTMTGYLTYKGTFDLVQANNGVTSKLYPTTFNILDKNSFITTRLESIINTDGSVATCWYIRNGYKSDGTGYMLRGIQMTLAKAAGSKVTYGVADPENFRSAIGLGTVATHAHSDYLTAVGYDTTNKKLTWSKGGTALTAFTVGFATDADTLDSKHADDFPQLRTSFGPTVDWNDIDSPGYYKVQHDNKATDWTNSPDRTKTYSYGLLEVIKIKDSNDSELRTAQIYYPHSTNKPLAMRMRNGSSKVWNAWTYYPSELGTIAYASLLKNVSADCTTGASTWNNNKGGIIVWGQMFKFASGKATYTPEGGSATNITDSGDISLFLTSSATSNTAELNMCIDGTYYGKFNGNLAGNASTSTTSTYSNALNVVAYNEIRFNSNKSTFYDQATDKNVLHINHAWADSAPGYISEYDFKDGHGSLTDVKASKFIGALQGNANTATKASYLSGWSSIVDATNNYPYHRILHTEGTGSWTDKSITLYISQGYVGGRFGIIRITSRSDDLNSTTSGYKYYYAEAKWLIRSGFNLSDIKIGVNNKKGAWNADVYYVSNGTYASIYMTVIDEGSRGSATSAWTRITSSETSTDNGASASPRYTTNTHDNCYTSSSLYTTYNVALANSTDGYSIDYAAKASSLNVNSGLLYNSSNNTTTNYRTDIPSNSTNNSTVNGSYRVLVERMNHIKDANGNSSYTADISHIAYTTNNTVSTLMYRDGSGNTNLNKLWAYESFNVWSNAAGINKDAVIIGSQSSTIDSTANGRGGYINLYGITPNSSGGTSAGTLKVRLKLSVDNEGGNIRIYTPSSYTYYSNSSGGTANRWWEIDAYNGDLRFFTLSQGTTTSAGANGSYGITLHKDGGFTSRGGATINGATTIAGNVSLNNGKNDAGTTPNALLLYQNRCNSTQTTGWADNLIQMKNQAGTTISHVGVFGEKNTLSYMYLGYGTTAYNGTNFRIYSDKVTFGTNTIYHTGNLPAYPTIESLGLDNRYVRLTENQTIAGNKTFTGNTTFSGSSVTMDSLTAGNLVVSGSSNVGTVTAGTWNGNKIDKSYLTLNSITAGTAGTSSATSGTSITIPYVTMDALGLVTEYGTHTHTITLPTGNITSHLYVTNSSGTTKTSTALTNGNVYLKLYEGTTAGESYKISGSGHIKVTTDTSGNISIYNDIATPLSATNKALSSASWVTIADCSNTSNYPIGTYAIQITDAGTDATNYYSGFITLSGTVGRLDEVALHAQMATVSDNDIPKRIYIAVEKGIIKASSLDSSATNHKLTVKVTRLI